ncbi:hypothetical protein CLAFUW4_11439 [Fulvia fulva]|nr:hypothetical protein CLAFUR4_11445 [Fulvia fulva]WPV16936.1 hypothetical protein CLAFUW4_11439 [Fulvia fulva]WPV32033.1 hypothetical protein CLAFUW7_11435 [Fulvia fulva]
MVSTRTRKYKVSKDVESRKSVNLAAQSKRESRASKWIANYPGSTRTTRAMATDSARQAVLRTAELLEHILLGLNFFDVWRCQRVCKQFQAVIQQSSRLQETMMHRLGSLPRQTWDHYFEPTSEAMRWKPCFRLADDSDTWSNRWSQAKPTRLTPAKLCPLLEISHYGSSELPTAAPRLQYRMGEAVTFKKQVDLQESLSWKELFVTDPPCTNASVTLAFSIGDVDSFQGGSIEVVRKVAVAEGLRLKHLVEDPLKMPGEVAWSLKWQRGCKHYKYPARLLRTFEDRLKTKAVLNRLRTIVNLEGMVIPTEEEWRAVS